MSAARPGEVLDELPQLPGERPRAAAGWAARAPSDGRGLPPAGRAGALAWDRERDRQRGEDEAEAIRAMMERHAEAAREGVELAAAAIGGRDLSEASFPELVKALAVLVGVVHARVEAG
jgi:hypothetical protein